MRGAAVYMNIGDNRQASPTAFHPKLGKGVGVKNADARTVGAGIEVVVVDGVEDLSPATELAPEEERAGFVPPFAPAFELIDDGAPATAIAMQPMLRGQ
jgi:hypothetical protein